MTLGLKNQKKVNESNEKSPAQPAAKGSGKGAKDLANGATKP